MVRERLCKESRSPLGSRDSLCISTTGILKPVIEAFIPFNSFNEADLKFILDSFQDDFIFSTKIELIKSQNWNEEWEKNYFKPLVISDECVISVPFQTDFPKTKFEIVIELNRAFGTGNETTSMMIETILESNMENKNG